MSATKHTVCPIVAEEDVEFVEGVLVGGLYKQLPFNTRIAWVRESECLYVFRYRGHFLMQRVATNDYYGFLTSFNLDEDVLSPFGGLGMTVGEPFTLDVDLAIQDVPVIAGDKVEYGRRAFRLPGDAWQLAKPQRGLKAGDPIQPVDVVRRQAFFTTGKHNFADPPPELLAEIEGWRREAAALAAKLVTAPAGQAAGSPPA